MTGPAAAAAHTSFSLSPERRRALLDEYFAVRPAIDEIETLIARAQGFDRERLIQHQRFYMERLTLLREEYAARVPMVSLSRCPFTGGILHHSLDHHDLDGLWWSYEAPARPLEDLPSTYFALTGALRVDGTVPWTPFVCVPGPEVPYVVPRLLNHPSIVAVVAAVPVGRHEAYAITYFANPVPWDIPRVNTWGTKEYRFVNALGAWRWGVQAEHPATYDFDLGPWIAAGKLRWIAAGDAGLTLRDSVADCPYLGLPGRRTLLRIYQGEVW